MKYTVAIVALLGYFTVEAVTEKQAVPIATALEQIEDQNLL